MNKYLLPVLIFIFSIQAGLAGNFAKSYIDTNNWNVYDFSVNPVYEYPTNNYRPFQIDAIDFLDSLHGIAALTCNNEQKPSYSGLIKTDDGGKAWYLSGRDSSLWVNPGTGITRLKYIDTNLIAALSYDASKPVPIGSMPAMVIKASRDGGKSWIYKDMAKQDCAYLLDSYGKDFIIVSQQDSAFVSTDRAVSWKPVKLLTSDINDSLILSYVYVIKPDDIVTIYLDWKTTQNYQIYHSYDTLKTENYFGTFNNHRVVYIDSLGNTHYGLNTTYFTFATPNIGWCSFCDTSKDIKSHYDYIYRTNNGGMTWEMQYKIHHMPDIDYFTQCNLQILSYDTLNVIAYGEVNKIIRTSNGGKTWRELAEPSNSDPKYTFNCNSASFVNQYDFYLTTADAGKIIKSKPDFLGIEQPEQESYPTDNSTLIYPNPVRDYFRIQDGEGKKIEVYSPEGKLMINTVYYSPIDLSHFSAGMYFIKIDNKMYKIVKV
jgi:hypothetical protein